MMTMIAVDDRMHRYSSCTIRILPPSNPHSAVLSPIISNPSWEFNCTIWKIKVKDVTVSSVEPKFRCVVFTAIATIISNPLSVFNREIEILWVITVSAIEPTLRCVIFTAIAPTMDLQLYIIESTSSGVVLVEVVADGITELRIRNADAVTDFLVECHGCLRFLTSCSNSRMKVHLLCCEICSYNERFQSTRQEKA
jgi:hypothetical protein